MSRSTIRKLTIAFFLCLPLILSSCGKNKAASFDYHVKKFQSHYPVKSKVTGQVTENVSNLTVKVATDYSSAAVNYTEYVFSKDMLPIRFEYDLLFGNHNGQWVFLLGRRRLPNISDTWEDSNPSWDSPDYSIRISEKFDVFSRKFGRTPLKEMLVGHWKQTGTAVLEKSDESDPEYETGSPTDVFFELAGGSKINCFRGSGTEPSISLFKKDKVDNSFILEDDNGEDFYLLLDNGASMQSMRGAGKFIIYSRYEFVDNLSHTDFQELDSSIFDDIKDASSK